MKSLQKDCLKRVDLTNDVANALNDVDDPSLAFEATAPAEQAAPRARPKLPAYVHPH